MVVIWMEEYKYEVQRNGLSLSSKLNKVGKKVFPEANIFT